MGYFPVRYDSKVVIYERKIFIRLATGHQLYRDTSPYVECSLVDISRVELAFNFSSNKP